MASDDGGVAPGLELGSDSADQARELRATADNSAGARRARGLSKASPAARALAPQTTAVQSSSQELSDCGLAPEELLLGAFLRAAAGSADNKFTKEEQHALALLSDGLHRTGLTQLLAKRGFFLRMTMPCPTADQARGITSICPSFPHSSRSSR